MTPSKTLKSPRHATRRSLSVRSLAMRMLLTHAPRQALHALRALLRRRARGRRRRAAGPWSSPGAGGAVHHHSSVRFPAVADSHHSDELAGVVDLDRPQALEDPDDTGPDLSRQALQVSLG